MVVSIGLPLLIVNGKFQSLGSMSVEDLETFIPFLVKCSVNNAGAQIVNGVPEWWSSTIQYEFPLQRPPGFTQIRYRRHLSSIVCRCYWYHNAEYLLPFCAEIANSPESVLFKSNDDNTTSIFYAHNTFHIMKFNNENKEYDMAPRKEKKERRCLLSALPKKGTIIPDIYLCENCGGEYSSLPEIRKHEQECYEINEEDEGFRRKHVLPQEVEVLEHNPVVTLASQKNNFFDYLDLHPSCSQNVMPTSGTSLPESHGKRWVSADKCLYRNKNVEFSSLFGKKLLEYNNGKRDRANRIEKTIGLTELYCGTTFRNSRELREQSDFKVTCRKSNETSWVHQYCFSKRERADRYRTLMTGLDRESRKLLKQCKTLRVSLTRLNSTS